MERCCKDCGFKDVLQREYIIGGKRVSALRQLVRQGRQGILPEISDSVQWVRERYECIVGIILDFWGSREQIAEGRQVSAIDC